MRRREFISLLGGAAAAWPMAARAQQPAMPIIGYLSAAASETGARTLGAFHEGLKEAGYVENQSVAIEYRWANGHYERLPGMAAELVLRRVTVIFASGAGGLSIQAAKAATTTIPIVFTGGVDPVQLGAVASLNRPGGNVTGVSYLANALEAKRLGLLHELVPQASTIAVLMNPDNASAQGQAKDLQEAARALGLELLVVEARSEREFDPAFVRFVQKDAGALLVATDSFFFNRRESLVALATRYAIPAIYHDREIATAGGLMSYGASITEAFHAAGAYVGRILKGEKPAELPIVQSTKLELVINLKTVKTLNLSVSPGLLAIADEVIE